MPNLFSFLSYVQLSCMDSLPLLHGRIWRWEYILSAHYELEISGLLNWHLKVAIIDQPVGLIIQDHMRKAGDVCFAEVSRDSEGIDSDINIYSVCWYANHHVLYGD